MYPMYDPEGQMAVYRWMEKRMQDEHNSGFSFVGTLIAAFFAAALIPLVIWLFVFSLGLTPGA